MVQIEALSSRRIAVVTLVALVGVAASIASWQSAVHHEVRHIEDEFYYRASRHAFAAKEHLAIYPEIMAQLRSIGSSEEPMFERMLQSSFSDLIARHPSVAIFEWVPLVTHDQRAAVEQQLSRQLGRTVGFTHRKSDGILEPAAVADAYYPITIAVPLMGNESVIGYDLHSALTYSHLAQARETGEMVATQQVTLSQNSRAEDLLAVIMIAPSFTRSNDSSGDEFRGFVQCIFRIHQVLSRLHRQSDNDALMIYYEDASARLGERRVLYANLAGHEPAITNGSRVSLPADLDPDDPAVFIENLPLGGRQWRFIARANPDWMAAQRSFTPLLGLFGGLATTFLLCYLLNTLMLRNRRVQSMVKSRTTELTQVRARLERDIEQRKAAEKNWRETEYLLRGLLENSSSSIFIKDLQSRYMLFNRQYEKGVGLSREEILGKSDYDMFPPDVARRYVEEDEQVLTSKTNLRYETEIEVQGKKRVMLVQKFPIWRNDLEIQAIGGIVTDLQYRAEAERLRRDYENRLQAGQRLESLGIMAGGIAHDFNNLLTAVLGHASMLRLKPDTSPEAVHQIEKIEVAARRASDLCDQMLTFAGQGSQETEHIDPVEVIDETKTLLSASLPKRVELVVDAESGLPGITANIAQFRQVIMNLVINSADAIGDEPGTIKLRLREVSVDDFDATAAVGNAELVPGRYVCICVSDTGKGVPPELLPKIFDPFFTTKFQGRGLGLSTVLGIVHGHHGAMFVDSSPSGTTFQAVFPVAEAPASDPSATPDPPPASVELSGGVLVVDDEPEVRDIAKTLLEFEGMTVFTAESGEAGLRVYDQHRDQIRIVLLDVSMPGLTGTQTLDALHERAPDLPVILLSGYSQSDPRINLGDARFHAFLQKPFELDALIHEINRAIAPG